MTPQRLPLNPPAQVVIIRHAEKPGPPIAGIGNELLTLKGVQRAAALVPFFLGDTAVMPPNPPYTIPGFLAAVPVALYAPQVPAGVHSYRSQQTLAPLARALSLTIQTPWARDQCAELASEVLLNPAYQGKAVLICWDHRYIAALAEALGANPPPAAWPGAVVFDRVWVLDYEPGSCRFSDHPQRLLYGDSTA